MDYEKMWYELGERLRKEIDEYGGDTKIGLKTLKIMDELAAVELQNMKDDYENKYGIKE